MLVVFSKLRRNGFRTAFRLTFVVKKRWRCVSKKVQIAFYGSEGAERFCEVEKAKSHVCKGQWAKTTIEWTVSVPRNGSNKWVNTAKVDKKVFPVMLNETSYKRYKNKLTYSLRVAKRIYYYMTNN